MKLMFAARLPALPALLALLCTSTFACAAPPDFSTGEGYARACAAAPAKATLLKGDEEKIAYVVCRDTALAKQVTTWVFQGMKQMQEKKLGTDAVIAEVVREIDHVRAELAVTRKVLDQVKLGKRTSLLLAPGQWELDLNSDGKIELWEKHFFAIPKRGHQPFRMTSPATIPPTTSANTRSTPSSSSTRAISCGRCPITTSSKAC